MNEKSPSSDIPPFEQVDGVPIQVVNTYSRLWQFETWLRTMVYVELRAKLGDDWAQGLKANSSSFRNDKSLTHMPTPEMNALSYAQLSDLTKLIDSHWECFSTYFPPKALWDAKLIEISQIRHRVAHFRVGHENDLDRLKLFLRDVDKGFWRFCTSYNDQGPILPQDSNPVSKKFLSLDPLPWREIEPGKWAQVGFRDKSIPVGLSVRTQSRPWATTPFSDGESGHLYDFYLFGQDGRKLDISYFLERTQDRHHHLVHLCLDDDDRSVRFTVPAVLGAPAVIDLVESFCETALYAAGHTRLTSEAAVNALADSWPEYVIGPSNPLTFLEPSMPCSFFGI